MYVVNDQDLARSFAEDLQERGFFTDKVPKGVGAFEIDLVLLCLDASRITHAALCERRRNGATGQYGVRFSDAVPLGIAVAKVVGLLRGDLRIAVGEDYFNGLFRLKLPSLEEWKQLWGAVRRLATKERDALDALELERTRRLGNRTQSDDETYTFTRDSVGLAAAICGMNRAKVLRSIPMHGSAETMLAHMKSEDNFIRHDATRLPGFVSESSVLSSVRLSNRDTAITIVLAHPAKIEHATGADLIYLNHRYSSCTMVQYKMMTHTKRRGWAYSPGGNYAQQFAQMEATRSALTQRDCVGRAERDFRLHHDPMFYKLCERTPGNVRADDLVPGQYYSLSHWERAICDPGNADTEVLQPIGDRNPGRHFSNSQFVDMVSHGWIGAVSANEECLAKVVDTLLAEKRAITIALSESLRT